MVYLDNEQLLRLLDYPALIDALETAFREGNDPPARLHYPIEGNQSTEGHLLLMPAWNAGRKIGIKIATVYPGNVTREIPTVNACYLLLDAATGVPLMIMDANELTRLRTASASALAARYLARHDSRTLLVVGTGALAPCLVSAHCTNPGIDRVLVWGRRASQAQRVADQFADAQFRVEAATDLKSAVAEADIISCATMATEPLVQGDWLVAGQHIDLVGSFTPQMREVDDEALRRADIFVDTHTGALSEAGELVQALAQGVISRKDIRGDLFQLARGECPGRQSPRQITLFKSVGTSLEDLAAAELAASRYLALECREHVSYSKAHSTKAG